MAAEKKITLAINSSKNVTLSRFQISGPNQLKLSISFNELNVTIEYVIDVGTLKDFIKANPGKTWRDWAKPILLNLYDSYALSKQIKESLEGEAV